MATTALHAFPTRRSSDLSPTSQASREADRASSSKPITSPLDSASSDAPDAEAPSRDRLLPAIRRTDRKSTRLNSSHLVISYAVFCLKKKKESRLLQHHIG